MNKHYIVASNEIFNNKQFTHNLIINNDKKNNEKRINDIKSIKKNILNSNDPSPRTMKRDKSRDNFMKYQWAWTL